MSGFDPKSLGKIVVAVAGAPQAIKASAFIVRVVTIQADPNNAGTYMLVKDSAGNIMARIAKGQSFTPPFLTSAGQDLSQIQLDTDTGGDGAFVSYV